MFHLIGMGEVEKSVIFVFSLGFKMFLLVFPSSSHVSESVNNSIFHQIAEQLQQQNLEHLRQQLLEQQQPQKVYNSILWSLELLLSTFIKWCFSSMVIFLQFYCQEDQPFQNVYSLFCYQNVFQIYTCAWYTSSGEQKPEVVFQYYNLKLHVLFSTQFPIKQGHDDFALVDRDDGKIDCCL